MSEERNVLQASPSIAANDVNKQKAWKTNDLQEQERKRGSEREVFVTRASSVPHSATEKELLLEQGKRFFLFRFYFAIVCGRAISAAI